MTSDLPTGSPPPVASHRRALGRLAPLGLLALLVCPRLPELPAGGAELELAKGEQRTWQVALAAGQALQVRAVPEEGDVELRLFDPKGREAAHAQGVRESGEAEEALAIAARPGIHRVELRVLTPVRCRLAVDGPRAAGPADGERADAAAATQKLYDRLRQDGRDETRPTAIAGVDRALVRWRRLGDGGREAALLYARGTARYAEHDWDGAEADLLAAARRAGGAGDEVLRADALNEAGRAARKQDRFRDAVELYEQALDIYRRQDKRSPQAITLSNLAMAHLDLGEARIAQRRLEESLSIPSKTATGERSQTISHHNLCSVLDALGDRQKALACHGKTLALARRGGHADLVAAASNNLGTLYEQLGEWERALELYGQALEPARREGSTDWEAAFLYNIGLIHQRCGRLPRAAACYRRALQLAGSDDSALAHVLSNLSLLRLRRGAPREAVSLARQALEHTSDRPADEALARFALSEALRTLGDTAAARTALEQTLAISKRRGDLNRQAAVFLSLARLARDQGDLAAALAQVDAALVLVESERARVESPDLRASFLASKQDYSEFKVDTLMELARREPAAGHAAAALQANEGARARSLLDVLNKAEAMPRRGVDRQLLERARRASEEVNIRAWQQRNAAPSADPRQLEAALKESGRVEAELRASSPRYKALTQARPLSLAEVQRQVLDGETVLLQYALGAQRSYLWAVTANSLQTWQLPPRSRIEEVATRLYSQLTERNRKVKGERADDRERRITRADQDLAGTAAELSGLVLHPAAAVLRQSRRVVVIADGALQYVPFGALPAPDRPAGASGPPLLEAQEVVGLPSASVLASIRRDLATRRPPAGSLAVFADPVFGGPDDLRVQHRTRMPLLGDRGTTRGSPPSPPFARLRFSGQEALAIANLAGTGDKVFRALGFAATRAAALSGRLAGFRRIHFATHGVLDSRRPEKSSLVLSLVDRRGQPKDGHLRLSDIYDLELNADLVVLSACGTALGKEVRGEGLVGLTRGFMYAGAARVVASLWSVDDKATNELMTLFYEGMLARGLPPAAALRDAQLRLRLAEDGRWGSPYYWGAFSLQGEWR